MREKIRVYICSLKGVSPFDYVDKESIGHPCVTSRNREDVFAEYKHYPGSGGCLPEDQKRIVDRAIEFCDKNDLEVEIVDIADLSFAGKMKVVFKGIKAPTISYKRKKITEDLEQENLKALLD